MEGPDERGKAMKTLGEASREIWAPQDDLSGVCFGNALSPDAPTLPPWAEGQLRTTSAHREGMWSGRAWLGFAQIQTLHGP